MSDLKRLRDKADQMIFELTYMEGSYDDARQALAAERAAGEAERGRLLRLMAPVVRELRGWVEADLEAGNDPSAVVAALEPAEAALREEAPDA